jgi:hypothetical protein
MDGAFQVSDVMNEIADIVHQSVLSKRARRTGSNQKELGDHRRILSPGRSPARDRK